MNNKATKWFVFACIALIAVFDVWVIWFQGGEVDFHRSISYHLNQWGKQYPITAVLAGVLIGHLYWPNN